MFQTTNQTIYIGSPCGAPLHPEPRFSARKRAESLVTKVHVTRGWKGVPYISDIFKIKAATREKT